MKSRLLIVLLAGVTGLAMTLAGCKAAKDKPATITGAGATFPEPVYKEWAHEYHARTGVQINYNGIGSGGGIKAINDNTVDFGASDAPLTTDELAKGNLVQFPMIIGGVVPVVNVKGVAAGRLKLTGEQLARIYLGRITRWNDESLKANNPGLSLPDQAIVTVNRADGSGTTWIFTNYLCKVSDEWKTSMGNNKDVAWKAPNHLGGKGNPGVANYVNQTDGAIGYVEYAYCLQNKMAYVLMQNKDGQFAAPTAESFQAAAANADWAHAAGYYMVLTDQPGKDAWPVVGASFILLHRQIKDPKAAQAMLQFFDWCYANGQDIAKKLDYVPIPANVVDLVQTTWRKELTSDGKAVWPVK